MTPTDLIPQLDETNVGLLAQLVARIYRATAEFDCLYEAGSRIGLLHWNGTLYCALGCFFCSLEPHIMVDTMVVVKEFPLKNYPGKICTLEWDDRKAHCLILRHSSPISPSNEYHLALTSALDSHRTPREVDVWEIGNEVEMEVPVCF